MILIGVALIVIGVLIYMFVLQDSSKKAGEAKIEDNKAPINPEDMSDAQKAEAAKK